MGIVLDMCGAGWVFTARTRWTEAGKAELDRD